MFKLATLPYAYSALLPVLSADTLEIHHDRHHRGYIEKLNELVKEKDLEAASLDDLVVHGSGEVFNNAAQVWNHEFYWRSLTPASNGGPEGALEAAIIAQFGSVPAFKRRFNLAATSHFGAGWTWLVVDANGGLDVVETHDAGTPLRNNQHPVLNCDVWEHAYYLDYQNERAKYLHAFWEIVNWQEVSNRYALTDSRISTIEKANRGARIR